MRFGATTLVAFCLALMLVQHHRDAVASTPDLFGQGSRAAALGGAFAAIADDFSAVYYNPAGITQLNTATVTLSALYVRPSLWLDDPGAESRWQDVPSTSGLYAGLVGPLGKLFGLPRLAAGLSVYLPFEHLIYGYIPANRAERHFVMYRDRSQRMSMGAAVAYGILEWLSIGVGMELLMDLGGETRVTYNGPAQGQQHEELELTITRELNAAKPAPMAGLIITPFDALRFGITYRGEKHIATDLGNSFDLDPVKMDTPLHFLSFYVPHQLTVGFGSKIGGWLTLSLDVTWMMWSGYRDSHQLEPELRLSDTFVFRMGVQADLPRGLSLMAGYYHEPTPVPDQVGESNLVDCDKNVISLGFGVDFRQLATLPLSVQLHLQAHLLGRRETIKDERLLVDHGDDDTGILVMNPGYPGYVAGGYLLGFGVTTSFYF